MSATRDPGCGIRGFWVPLPQHAPDWDRNTRGIEPRRYPPCRATRGRRSRRDAHFAVRHNRVVGITGVERRLEDLHPLARNLSAAKAADQLLALAAEHAADDDFNPALVGLLTNYVHRAPGSGLRAHALAR